jgi:hypothetical protein
MWQQNHVANTVFSSANILGGLLPATTFDIYCLTERFRLYDGLTVSSLKKLSIVTECGSVSISVLIQSMYQGDSSVNAIPSDIRCSPDNLFDPVLEPMLPSVLTSAPSASYKTFHKAIKTTTVVFYSLLLVALRLVLSHSLATLGGVSQAEYQVVFTNEQ